MPRVSPDVLLWARETSGLSVTDAAHKIGFKSTTKATAEERLAALETGAVAPSVPQLRKMAKVYRRPLVSLYLSKPPIRGERGEDFRTLPESEHRKSDPLLEVLLRDIKARQNMVSSLLLEDDDVSPLSFVGSQSLSNGSQAVGDSIVRVLGFDLGKFRSKPNLDVAFSYLRELAERVGIFVVLAGNLGSHHTTIEVEAFRGFALADVIAPFVLINDQDAKSAWSFTLLHELAHLWLGQTGVSGERIENQKERFCSDVASSILLPDIDLFDFGNAVTLAERANAIGQFANARRISASMVSYRLQLVGRITLTEWRSLSGLFRQQWLRSKEQVRAKQKEIDGGPNYYVVRRHRVGAALLSLVGRSIEEGTLSPTKAGKVLGVKPRSVARLLNLAATSSPPYAA
ncbi:MAG: ImmA/IrrE family metallo-endopeptidase [Proteobacteria bacterium]|nr:ImmA/IrrE family metallo-endopeptidase [Pseudomonadota bacterium]